MNPSSSVDRDAIDQQLAHCQALLSTVGTYTTEWRARGGRAFQNLGEVILQTIFARSTRTYEAITVHLGSGGFGEQAAMLNRSLFEDMVDAHWVSLNPDLAVERLRQHHRYSNRLKLDVAPRFPQYFGTELPELSPRMDESERSALARIFGGYGERSWTGLNLHDRFAAIEECWSEGTAREQARFFYLWVQRENNETLHLSSYSLAKLNAPKMVDEGLLFLTGPTEHLLPGALMFAFWTYVQTVCLVFETFGLQDLDALARDVIEPGLVGVASAALKNPQP